MDAVILACLALNIFFEARNEPVIGQIAVAHVTLNRVKATQQDLCAVVFAPKQFSWTDVYAENGVMKKEHKPSGPRWERSKVVAHTAYEMWVSGRDVTNGAMYFHAKYVTPAWKKTKPFLATVGEHHFYGETEKGMVHWLSLRKVGPASHYVTRGEASSIKQVLARN